jgi:hypothetical protein
LDGSGYLRIRPSRAADCGRRLYGYIDAWSAREEDNQVTLPEACRATLIAALNARFSPVEMAHHMRLGAQLNEDAAIAEALQNR